MGIPVKPEPRMIFLRLRDILLTSAGEAVEFFMSVYLIAMSAWLLLPYEDLQRDFDAMKRKMDK